MSEMAKKRSVFACKHLTMTTNANRVFFLMAMPFDHISIAQSTVLKNQSFVLLLLSMAPRGIGPKLITAALK